MWADQFQGLNNPLNNEVTWCASGNLPTLLRNFTTDNIYSKTRLIVAAIDMCCNSGRLHVQTRLLALWPRNRDSITAADGGFLVSKMIRPALQFTQPYTGTRDSFPGRKVSRTWSWPHRPEAKKFVGLYLHSSAVMTCVYKRNRHFQRYVVSKPLA
jgi:hypothetical protein